MLDNVNIRNKCFDQLVGEVIACKKCPRMKNSERVLGYSSGNLFAEVMFIGEAPGRLGADESLIPFHGDQSGHNFEALLEHVGINRYQSYITNAVLCNPRDEAGNNSTPTKEEVKNCSGYLKRQVDLVQPKVVVTLGATALKAVSNIEQHSLTLTLSVRSSKKWYGRALIPLYHPGQRAMLHRSFTNQLADYQFVVESLRRLGEKRRYSRSGIPSKTVAIVEYLISLKPEISYFALHKLFFLIEVHAIRELGRRMTDSYIIRQKDGPYCVDLHAGKLRRSIKSLVVENRNGKLLIRKPPDSLFPEPTQATDLDVQERKVVLETATRYADLSDFELKRRTYLTLEMRKVLREERQLKRNMFNAPLLSPA